MNPGVTELTVHAITALIQAERESVLSHCVELEESCTSSIYHSAVVSDDVVPAGVFLIILRDAIESTIKRQNELLYLSPHFTEKETVSINCMIEETQPLDKTQHLMYHHRNNLQRH